MTSPTHLHPTARTIFAPCAPPAASAERPGRGARRIFILRHVWEPVVGTAARASRTTTRVRISRSSVRAPSSSRSTTRRARRSSSATPASTARSRMSTRSASRRSRTPTRCSPRSRAAISTASTRCRSPSPTSSASRARSSSSRPGERDPRLRVQLESQEEENRELLDPKAARSPLARIRPKQIVDVVFRGHAAPRATLLTPISAPYMNTKLAAREVRPRARQLEARQARLQARDRTASASRRAPTPTHGLQRGHAGRASRASTASSRSCATRSPKIGVKLTQHAFDGDDRVRRDHEAEEQVPGLRHDDVGLGRLHRPRLRALRRRLRPVRRLERHRLLQQGVRQALPAAGHRRSIPRSARRSSGRCRRSSIATSPTSSSSRCS